MTPARALLHEATVKLLRIFATFTGVAWSALFGGSLGVTTGTSSAFLCPQTRFG